jgi:hypothetical protein
MRPVALGLLTCIIDSIQTNEVGKYSPRGRHADRASQVGQSSCSMFLDNKVTMTKEY